MLKAADAGRPVNEIWRSYGISSATDSKGNATQGGLEASDLTRRNELEHEHGRRKRMQADLSLEHAARKEVIAKKHYGRLSGGSWARTWLRGAAVQFSEPVRRWGLGAPRTIGPWFRGPSAMARSLRP